MIKGYLNKCESHWVLGRVLRLEPENLQDFFMTLFFCLYHFFLPHARAFSTSPIYFTKYGHPKSPFLPCSCQSQTLTLDTLTLNTVKLTNQENTMSQFRLSKEALIRLTRVLYLPQTPLPMRTMGRDGGTALRGPPGIHSLGSGGNSQKSEIRQIFQQLAFTMRIFPFGKLSTQLTKSLLVLKHCDQMNPSFDLKNYSSFSFESPTMASLCPQQMAATVFL